MKAVGYSYIRFSSREQRKGDSLRRQTEATVRWCERNGVTLDTSTTLHDLGVSAKEGKHRENPDKHALAAFLKLIEEDRIPRGSYLIVENLDRLSREHVRAATKLFFDILDAGINIVTTTPERVFRHDSTDTTDIIIAVVELSRGNSESVIKSERVGAAWKRRKANARNEPITAQCPKWLKVEDLKYHVIEERAEVVRRIFRQAREGDGIGVIANALNKDKVLPFGGGRIWQKSSVARILKNRAVFGEYQPCEGSVERKAVGDPLKDYYPVVVSESEFYAAQQGKQSRRKTGGRERTKSMNLFTSLVVDGEDGTRWMLVNNNGRCIANHEGQGKGAGRKALPYRIFERAILDNIAEVSPAELLPKGEQQQGDRLADLNIEINATDAKMREVSDAITTNPEVTAYLTVLGNLDRKKKELIREYEDVKRQLATPVVAGLSDAQTLIGLLETTDDEQTLRNHLRAKIAAVVERIEVWFTSPGKWSFKPRQMHAIIRFRNTTFARAVMIEYQPARCNRPEKVTVTIVEGDVHQTEGAA
jgi:DNA invertase Pin-like site-specific DNA recombinase